MFFCQFKGDLDGKKKEKAGFRVDLFDAIAVFYETLFIADGEHDVVVLVYAFDDINELFRNCIFVYDVPKYVVVNSVVCLNQVNEHYL